MDDADADADDNTTRRTEHDCIGSLPNEPKTKTLSHTFIISRMDESPCVNFQPKPKKSTSAIKYLPSKVVLDFNSKSAGSWNLFLPIISLYADVLSRANSPIEFGTLFATSTYHKF